MMEKVRVGIAGGAGYTAGELLRLLVNHPYAHVTSVESQSHKGASIGSVHKDLFNFNMNFVETIEFQKVDLIFLCKGHGQSKKYLMVNTEALSKKIIDLSMDFRLENDLGFVYGLPEINRSIIAQSSFIANPGCFATAIQLSLIPLLKNHHKIDEVHISGLTGSTGAGQSLTQTSHFSWRNSNASSYKVMTHQHLDEVFHTCKVSGSEDIKISFVPYRGAFTRGIITTSYFNSDFNSNEVHSVFEDYYNSHSFTHTVKENPDLKWVLNSNNCVIFPTKVGDKVVITTVIDNLLKGASGQAVQNMNLMYGFEETDGLNLKTNAF